MTDIIPEHISSSSLAKVIEYECKALKALNGEPRSVELNRVTSNLVQVLRACFDQVRPSEKTFNQVVSTGFDTALSALLDCHDIPSYIAMSHAGQLDIHAPIKAGNIDMLRTLHAAGFHLFPEASKILRNAMRHAAEDGLDFVRNTLGSSVRIIDAMHPVHFEGAMQSTFAAALAQEIIEGIADKEPFVMGLLTSRLKVPAGGPKIFAIQVWSGIDLMNLYGNVPSEFPKEYADLMKMTSSSHGRIALRTMEPSLQDILERPKDASFFGHSISGTPNSSSAPLVV